MHSESEHLPKPTTGQREPWPWILAACLLTMISISSAFAWMAITHPDPVVFDEVYEASGKSFEPRLRDPDTTR